MGKQKVKLYTIPKCECGERPELKVRADEFYAPCFHCESPFETSLIEKDEDDFLKEALK